MSAARRYDVAVIGAGPAGIAAALAAAHVGARAVLVERQARVGGNVSEAFVHTICGLYLASPAHEAVIAHPGLPAAFAERLARRSGAGRVDWSGSAGFLAIDPDAFCDLARELCSQAPGLELRTRATLRSLTLPPAMRDDADCSAIIEDAAGATTRIRARFVVDTTGDATAAAAAGAATMAAGADELQHASYIFRMEGVDTDALTAMERARTTTAIARAAATDRLPSSAGSAVVRPGIARGTVFVTLNRAKPTDSAFDPLDASLVARMTRDAAEDATQLARYLVDDRAPFRAARVAARPERIGIRETRRVRGLEQLELADVIDGRRRDDEACVTTWPVEIWSSHRRMSFEPTAGPASIPLACLVADHPSGRLAMAGRCASASHEALGAIRVIATAMAMGEAAGAACAIAAGDMGGAGDLPGVDPGAVRSAIAAGRTTAAR